MTIGVIQFPGSNCDHDTLKALQTIGKPAELVWHKSTNLEKYAAIILPGGFSYGDYLRCGAIARFSPVMQALNDFAAAGKPVLGICNGFQILCECGLLPGALIRNNCLEFRCETVELSVEDAGFFNPEKLGCDTLRLPIAHGEGNYRIDPPQLEALIKNQQILLRYQNYNPNGAIHDIAGIRNLAGNVWGMMPHPERAVENFHPNRQGLPVLQAFSCMPTFTPTTTLS